MKHPKLILILCTFATSVVLFSGCNRSQPTDDGALEAARKEAAAVSNQLSEVSMKLNHQEQMVKVLEMNATNLVREIHQFSNQVVSLREQFAAAQRETLAAQAEAPKRDVRILELETKCNELAAKVARLTTQLAESESRIPPLEKRIAADEKERAQLLAQIERLNLERADLLRLWDDEKAVAQRLANFKPKPLKKATKSAAAAKPALVLNPDGSVRTSP